MAIGRTFKEALQKGLRGLEIGRQRLRAQRPRRRARSSEKLLTPDPDRIFYVKRALDLGWTARRDLPHDRDRSLVPRPDPADRGPREGRSAPGRSRDAPTCCREAKRMGFSDARHRRSSPGRARGGGARARARRPGSCPSTSASTPARPSSSPTRPTSTRPTSSECEARAHATARRSMILGSGPNRIGQGIEFDYCCCHASFAFKEEGYETIMVNCNPETVSTDYDTSDRLYFEPLTFEDVMNIVELEKPEGVVDPVRRADAAEAGAAAAARRACRSWAPAPTRSTWPRTASASARCSHELGHPAAGERHRHLARRGQGGGARASATRCWCGRPTCWAAAPWPSSTTRPTSRSYVREAVKASPEHPILVDRFLEDAFEVDVDAVGDGERVVIGGILQHIEEAGIHSGDSAMVLPTYKIAPQHLETIRDYTRRLGLALGVRGLMNVQYAIKDDVVYVLEVNPRASRTDALRQQGDRRAAGQGGGADHGRPQPARSRASPRTSTVDRIFVKESVFPFLKFPGTDILLGPEMKSTGEVMGISERLRHRLRQGAGRGRLRHPDRGHRLHQRQRPRQGRGAAPRARARRDGLPHPGHPRHRRVPERPRRARGDGLQGQRGPAQRAWT